MIGSSAGRACSEACCLLCCCHAPYNHLWSYLTLPMVLQQLAWLGSIAFLGSIWDQFGFMCWCHLDLFGSIWYTQHYHLDHLDHCMIGSCRNKSDGGLLASYHYSCGTMWDCFCLFALRQRGGRVQRQAVHHCGDQACRSLRFDVETLGIVAP